MNTTRTALWAAMALALLAAPVHAYVGPGIGITLVGWLAGAIAFVGAALGATLHWPLRKLFRRLRRRAPGKAAEAIPANVPNAGDGDVPASESQSTR